MRYINAPLDENGFPENPIELMPFEKDGKEYVYVDGNWKEIQPSPGHSKYKEKPQWRTPEPEDIIWSVRSYKGEVYLQLKANGELSHRGVVIAVDEELAKETMITTAYFYEQEYVVQGKPEETGR